MIDETTSPWDRSVVLTHKGDATVHLMRLRTTLTKLSLSERAEIVADMRTMLNELDQAA